jgi:AbiV family abortive infection protein
MFEDIEKLMPPPGHFTVISKEDLVEKDNKHSSKKEGRKLDIFKEPEVAKKVYEMYVACWNNAVDLLNEAKLLYQNVRYARSIALGIAAWEELGKSQIAADYYSGVVSDIVYREAFRNHGAKTSYLVRTGVAGLDNFTVATQPEIGKRLEKIRQNALYVSETNDPKEAFTKDHAEFVLERVREHLEYIRYAEEFNGRIGSKALFK